MRMLHYQNLSSFIRVFFAETLRLIFIRPSAFAFHAGHQVDPVTFLPGKLHTMLSRNIQFFLYFLSVIASS